jgi:hypothetical protein
MEPEAQPEEQPEQPEHTSSSKLAEEEGSLPQAEGGSTPDSSRAEAKSTGRSGSRPPHAAGCGCHTKAFQWGKESAEAAFARSCTRAGAHEAVAPFLRAAA